MTTLHTSLTSRSTLPEAAADYWWRLAYRNRAAEWTLYALLLTGLPLVAWWAADWPLQRWSLALHSLLGVFGATLVVVPFWLAHRRLLQTSRKAFLRVTGRLMEILLLIIAISGFYLVWWGNRGDPLDIIMHWAHLIATLTFAPLLLRHAFRWSVLRPLWLRLGWLRKTP